MNKVEHVCHNCGGTYYPPSGSYYFCSDACGRAGLDVLQDTILRQPVPKEDEVEEIDRSFSLDF